MPGKELLSKFCQIQFACEVSGLGLRLWILRGADRVTQSHRHRHTLPDRCEHQYRSDYSGSSGCVSMNEESGDYFFIDGHHSVRFQVAISCCLVLATCQASMAFGQSESLPELQPAAVVVEIAPETVAPVAGTARTAVQVSPHQYAGPSQHESMYGEQGDPLQPIRLDGIRAGYDDGFVVASARNENLNVSDYAYKLKINGWGQIRHTISDIDQPNNDLNQFQLKRGRLLFSGSAFSPDVSYFVQLDGRSSSGETVRLLDYSLSFDVGHRQLGLEKGRFGFRTGKYKMPFTMARWMSGKEFEFVDRSMASTFFDVNRSFAWGVYGRSDRWKIPVHWEAALFNGLVTGGAETGSSGTLDQNFAYSARAQSYLFDDWGKSALADFECHDRLAMRFGGGFASSQIDREGASEFGSLRVVDSGRTLESILPLSVPSYAVALWSVDVSTKYRGWSTSFEYYFRRVSGIADPAIPDLFDHGFWLQLGCFVVPEKLQLLSRWSRIVGDSGTLGAQVQSSDEISGGLAWYFKQNKAKSVLDLTYLDGASINSSALDISPGDRGWLLRSQIQFSF